MNPTSQDPPIRVAILSFLFNWPSTGGGIVHTVELADFLRRAAYEVRHIYARHLPWGIGRVTQAVPFDSRPIDFDESTFQATTIQAKFRQAVDEFDPDYVIITDSWNFKPLLAEAVRGYPYLLRLQASECLCPLNNLRFLPTGEQCANHQLADAGRCRSCVGRWAGNSGGLHQAERALVGFGTPRYEETLRRAFADAEAVLVVNELAATMVGPYARAVRVVTSGFDPARFPPGEDDAPSHNRDGRKLQILMAGLVEDRIKGFDVLDAACQRLWQARHDFELIATGEPARQVNEYTRFVGWLSQDELPRQMREADIVVVPTVAQDALGRTAVEAMAADRPVVASRIGGLPYTIADGAGLLFEPGDAGDLANKLNLLLDDPRLRQTMGTLGRRRFEQHFTWQAIIDKHYRPLLAARRNATPRNGTESVPYRDERNATEGVPYRDEEPPIPTRSASEATTISTRSASEEPKGNCKVKIANCKLKIDNVASEAATARIAASAPHIRRIALIYDDERRPETTGVYCRRALEKLADVQHFRPAAIDSIPRGAFDLILNIDDGLRYRLPDDLRPSAWWCIDTHIDFDWCLEKARDFDFVFAAQRDGAERLRQNSIASAQWLPLACDAEIHGAPVRPHPGPLPEGEGELRPHPSPLPEGEGEKKFDVCFVGNLIPGARLDLLRLIQQHFKNIYVGQAYFEEMAKIYAASRIVFNRSVGNDVNMRVFEALASGSLLLTNHLAENGQDELFRDGVHLATYRDGHDLLDKLRYYLRRDDVRDWIAAAGRAEVLAKHTYRHRMEEILRMVGNCKLKIANCQLQIDNDAQRRDRLGSPSSDRSYFEFARPELLALVPSTAQRIIEIGCGAGRLGESIKARQTCHITGIEVSSCAAEAARRRLDHVIEGDVEELALDFAAQSFDCVICGDVLEHLRQPDQLLWRIHEWLATDGVLVASIPNVAHHSVIANLLRGDWEYEPAGLLDATHLRFFTRRSIERMLYRAHLEIQSLQASPGPADGPWWQSEKRDEAQIGPVHAQGLSRQQAEELHSYQYLLTAKAIPVRDYGLTSIVILTHNEWPYTERCLESIRFRTDEPYELIVVDNGSTDGTPERLRGIPDVTLIANAENRGFPAGVNQGIAAARGRQILLLNNDVVVTTGWLTRMLEVLEKAEGRRQKAEGNPKSKIENPKSVGLVGPLTNCASGYQEIAVSYTDLDALDGFAWEHGQRHAGQLQEVDRLIGFCLLIRREVTDQIGLFDERFGIGNFEDDDFCCRARDAGWRLAVAQDAFIHHFGHRTFDGAGVDLNALLTHNRRRFDKKWEKQGTGNRAQGTGASEDGVSVGNGLRAVPPAVDASLPPGDGRDEGVSQAVPPVSGSSICNLQFSIFNLQSPPSPSRPLPHSSSSCALSPVPCSLSLCMIVRNNASTIRAALESAKPWVDEMIVVDTGSTDATPEICRELGAKVYHFPWPDSFSVARNESLKHARGEWIFWMDSDDVIDATNGRQLRELVNSLPLPPGEGRGEGPVNPKSKIENPKSPLLGFVMQVHCPGPGDGQHDVTVVDHVKLFRNLPELRFEGRIHEQVLPNIRRLGGEVQFTDIFVVHAGADHSAPTRRAKLKRDLHLLKLELREQPGHPFTLFNLGMTYADAGKHRRAIGLLRQSLAASDPAQSQVRKAYALLAASYLQIGKLRSARRTCRQGLKLFPADPELLFRAALVAHRLGRLQEAEHNYLAVLEIPNAAQSEMFATDVGQAFQPDARQAGKPDLLFASGRVRCNKKQRHFSSIDRAIVGFKARQNLAAVYTDMRDLKRAEDEWRKIVAEVPDYRDGWLGLVENLLEQGDLLAAEAIAGQLTARAEQTGQTALRTASLVAAARLAEAYQDAPGALGAARAAVAADANDPLPREILCRLLFQTGNTAEAAVELARLVELDGANAAAQHNLGVARLQTGDFAGAAHALQTSLRLRPKSSATRDALAFARQMLDVGQAFQPDVGRAADNLPAIANSRRQAGKPDLLREAIP